MINKYKYIVTYNAVDTEVFPMFDSDAEIKYENKGDEIALLKKFSGKLVFSNKNGSADYDYFLDIETNGQCVLLQLDVQQLCAGVYTSIITAEFGIVDGEWDKDNCTFTVEPNPNGLYACLLSGTKVNIVDVPQTISAICQLNSTLERPTFLLAPFEDVLLYVAQQSCSDVNSIISDFFQINPVNVSTVNSITGMDNVYTEMGMTALSNVRNPLPSNPATTELTTWKDLMDDLRTMFNVYWTVDVNGDIRLEHFNFFNSGAGLDLTQPQYDKYLSGTNKYKYNRKDSPRYETWTMNSSEQSGEITYDNACGNNKLDEDRITYTVKKIYTDFSTAWLEPSKLSGSTPGIFLFATNGIINSYGSFDMLGTSENAELVLPRLVLKFHRWGRPQLNGTFKPIPKLYDYTLNNSEDLFIYSEKPVKEQTEITIPLCCDETFDSAKYQTTFMGVKGIVMNAVHKLRDNILRLSLKYKVNADNVDVLPSAISDLAVWLIGDTGKTVSGGLVTNWADQSGNGNDFEQPTVADQPTDASDHLIFDGDMMFSSAAFQTFPAKRGSVFIVSKSSFNDLPGVDDITFLAIDSANKWDISMKHNNDQTIPNALSYFSFSENAYYPTHGFISNLNTGTAFFVHYGWSDYKFIFELIRDGNTSQTVWLNGKGTHESPMTIANTQPDVDNLILGGIDATNNRYYGKIYEIIIYDRALTPIERQKVEQYLAKKYELNLYSVS